MADVLDIAAPAEETDLARFGAIASRSLGFSLNNWAERCERVGRGHFRLVKEGADIAGGMAILPMGHWFGGRVVPSWGISLVAIAPEHRSRGIASELMRAVLEEARREGVALSSLYPATRPLYWAAGYETAGSRISYRLSLAALRGGSRDRDVRAASSPDDRAKMMSLYDVRARWLGGAIARTTFFWQRVFDPLGDEARAYVVLGERAPEGYVVVSQRPPPAPLQPMQLVVRDAVAHTAAAGHRILRFLADHHSTASSVTFVSGPADPLLLLVREEAREVADFFPWMLRIVDVRAALERRGWSPLVRGELHIDVRDALLRENSRRWVIEVADGKAEVREGGTGALPIDVRGLAALYSGFLPAEELRGAGLCGGDDAELARATALFAGPAPWLSDFF